MTVPHDPKAQAIRNRTDVLRQIERALDGLQATTDALVAIAVWAKAQDPPESALLDDVQYANARMGELLEAFDGIRRVVRDVVPPGALLH